MPSPAPSAPPDGAAELDRRGLATGFGAFLWWGLLPLYFPLLVPAGALEISAHRVVWSLVFCFALLAGGRSLPRFIALLRDRRTALRLSLAALLLAVNWVTFLVGVLTGRVLDASLGYFINPIVTVLLAVVVLRERLRRTQWVAIGIAALGVFVIGVGYGSVPWIAVILAVSFGLYGLVKKQVGPGVEAVPGLAVETLALTPLALGYLLYLALTGDGTFLQGDGGRFGMAGHALILVSSGVVTAVPLLLFAAAARRLPLTTLGSLQFVAPIMQFLIGVAVFGEEMAPTRWLGFVLIWCALAVLSVDGYRTMRANPRSLVLSPGNAGSF